MHRILLAMAVLAPGLAACASPSMTAQLDLKDACVFSGPATETAQQPEGLDRNLPVGFFNVNGQLVPYQAVTATLIHRRSAPPACSPHIG